MPVSVPIARVPPGTIAASARADGSSGFGWLLCNGAAVSRSTYAALFAAIGVTYGAGDGSTTFNVPDMAGRTLVGSGAGSGLTTRGLNDPGGAESHAITQAELPTNAVVTTGGTADQGSTGSTGRGSATAMSLMQPYCCAYWKIKT